MQLEIATLEQVNAALKNLGCKCDYKRIDHASKALHAATVAKLDNPTQTTTKWADTRYAGRRVFTSRGPGTITKADRSSDPQAFLVQLDDGREVSLVARLVRFHALNDSYRDKYVVDRTVRTASGAVSIHNGDKLAEALLGLCAAELRQVAGDNGYAAVWEKYIASGQNPGMARMHLGNRLRGKLRRGEVVRVFNQAYEGL